MQKSKNAEKKPKLTAVLPTWNNSAFLAKSIESLRKQSLKDIEILVIDDCSNDSTIKLLNWFSGVDKRIRYYKMETRKGAAVCRNLGNALAKSDLIMVCDSGDINHVDRANDAYRYMKKHKNIDIYSTACIEINTMDENIRLNYPKEFTDKEKPSLFHPTVTYRKRVTEQIKYREGNLSTDQYEVFFFEAYRAGFKFAFTEKGFVKKLVQNRNDDNIKERLEQRKANYKEFGINANI